MCVSRLSSPDAVWVTAGEGVSFFSGQPRVGVHSLGADLEPIEEANTLARKLFEYLSVAICICPLRAI
jgi:hypothetical protein